ncbi:BZ3500_MvSof-1268-A1-R1_Chr8-2g10270 [Microbotryum saponariae]|uniref:BZ3500_MvSof-1268-A1-R1_Chr8-2g10270 protein n=1 Tax=Microbotryum saponariae TaxID=289078 RepID=A0A2X0LBI0_9BASI|nr:BZ3500_MvSof-1268-A1-R1_Chr8-2g10270 [Microbotryum saponariae]SDA02068.1 BZ3501_MvSof-1269-A2-R1_Chr8-2g10020 [Microbotryum saponariae]
MISLGPNKRSAARSSTSTWATPGLALIAVLVLVSAIEVTAETQSFRDHSAQFSRYKPAEEYTPAVSRCKVEQVIVLERGGASRPDAHLAASIQASLAKVVGKSDYKNSQLNFLANYTYNLGSDGALLPMGQIKELWIQFRKRYCDTEGMWKQDCLDYSIASADSPALVDSAKNWRAGLLQGANAPADAALVTINSTLAAPSCPNLVSSVPTAQQQWRDVWTPAVIQRLQSGGENYGLNSTDVINFAYMCALESAAIGSTSPFCGLFIDSEWSHIEYDGDLGKYFNHAYGAPLARTQAVRYTTELLSRLTWFFPLIRRQAQPRITSKLPVYVDVTSDDQLLSFMTLLGFFDDATLSTTLPCPMRSFVTSKMIPFAGRIVVERMTCTGHGFWKEFLYKISDSSPAYVRVLVNDKSVNLSQLCDEDDRVEGGTMCTLTSFSEHVKARLQEATKDSAKCR